LHSEEDWNKNPNYPQAFSLTKYLFDKYGKEKMFVFLSGIAEKIGSKNTFDKFEKNYLEYFGILLEENKLVWSKTK